MFRFFKELRNKLLAENRFRKYMLYATGEILLVVIGILIALQVNNWNEDRLKREDEFFVAQDLYVELLESEKYLDQTLELWRRRNAFIQVLSDTLVTENLQLGQRAFDSILIEALTFRNFTPRRRKLDRVLGEENFEFSQSKDLIKEMMNLAGLYDALNVYFSYNLDTWKEVVQPYLITNYSFRNLNTALGIRHERNYPNRGHENLLADPVFDNVINNMQGDVIPFIMLLVRSLDKIGELKLLLESSYPEISSD
ncbi:hypothetical protein SAMN06265375_101457 [Muriicola jejuensis]|uniref:Uncharacterized protein n=1 Tax=Muriicola jejuensis TaxID=504488 RepID=A0A6P0U9X8_9FLAO|nr:DUF6090 family protein [Muriicola jejuensis]NER10015.1 hypothetical protein [Muriicola jejuensis]SMP03748.1 hypothetical protein SAMN06265375_101457 [Muriicola jejuensis]